MMYDVIIIGGGLAGLSLAIDLKKRGYLVLVIEKGSYPRHKVCGEYISMESHNYLNYLCPSIGMYDLPQINKFLLSSTGRAKFKTKLGLGGFGISRYLLDNLLFVEAKKTGVNFTTNNKALAVSIDAKTKIYAVKTKTGDFISRLVCNASGRKSNLEIKKQAYNLKETNYVGVKYHLKTKRDAHQIEIHNFPGGYCGISNIEDGKSCLCYIVNSKMLNNVNKSISEMEKKYLYQNENLKNIFSNGAFISKEPVTVSGINFTIKDPYLDDVFYLGDAAGCIAPITGNGMSISLRSAFVLAGYLDDFFCTKITKQQLIESYRDFWIMGFYSRIKISRYFQKLSEHPILTKSTIWFFKSFPFIAKFIIKQTHGKPF